MAKISINIGTGEVQKDSNVIIGIDLGTTNSLVAYIKDGAASAVRSKDGKHALVPSVLHFEQSGGILVGSDAKEKLTSEIKKLW